jgi:predicted RNase H-like nuclease
LKTYPPANQVLNLSSLAEYLNNLFFAEIPRTGAALKAFEDQLDSLICAYVGAHWWHWGKERNLVLGEQVTGYIVVPKSAKNITIEF